jgi:hypothetical protein
MGLVRDLYGVPMGFVRNLYGFPMAFVRDSPWDFAGIPMGLVWDW